MGRQGLGIVLLAKYPSPGFVKTRLASSIGSEKAASVAAALLSCMIECCAGLAADECVLSAEPADPPLWKGLVPADWRIEPQGSGDLGERLSRAVTRELERYERVVVAGADHAGLPEADFRRFAAEDFALWPTNDGGYAALTVSAHARVGRLFEAIRWSTGDVAAETLARAREIGIEMRVYPETRDVDTGDDLDSLAERLAGRSDLSPALANLATVVQNSEEVQES